MAETWDETKPAGSRSPALGDDDIREFKVAIRERLAADHDFEASESPAFGAAGSTLVAENRITRLAGARSMYFLTHASRVGIQCATSGERLATSNIFAKCFKF